MKARDLLSVLVIALCAAIATPRGAADDGLLALAQSKSSTSTLSFELPKHPLDNNQLIQTAAATNIYAFNYRSYTPDWSMVNVELFHNHLQPISTESIPFQDIDRCVDLYEILYPFHEFS